jgi:parvulin-like peptidyl-prolyl isomerase
MMKLLVFIAIFVATMANAALPNIVALVNNEPITLFEFECRKNMLVKLNNIENPSTNIHLNKYAMNTLIDESILEQHATKVGGRVSDEEIDEAIASIEKKNNMPSGYLVQSFENKNIAESFRSQIRAELIKMNILSYLSKSVTVSPREIDVVILGTDSKEVKISAQIFTSKNKDETALSKMSSLRKSLNNCKTVKSQSYDKFADLSVVEENLNTIDAQLQTMIKDLRPNQPSKIFETPEGFKIILLCNKEFNNVTTEENSYITNFLTNKKVTQKAQKFFDALRKKAYIKVMIPM